MRGEAINRSNTVPAGFWLRFFAYLIDLSILSIPALLLGHFLTAGLLSLIASLIIPSGSVPNETVLISLVVGMLVALFVTLLLQAIISFLYFPLFESSQLQATPGKWIFKLAVADESCAALSIARAFGRNIARWAAMFPFLAGLILALGAGKILGLNGLAALVMVAAILLTTVVALVQYPMAGLTANKQALHDIVAHTIVYRREQMPFGETTAKAVAACVIYVVFRALSPDSNAHSS